MLTPALLLALATLAGASLPLALGRSERLVHGLVAFSTGLFLGAVFSHLVPEVAAEGGTAGWLALLAGAGALLLLEHLIVRRRAGDPHAALGWASSIGLGVHALAAGLGLAAMREADAGLDPVLLSMAAHKAAEGFSLASIVRLAGLSRWRALLVSAAFALVTPIALLLGGALLGGGGGGTLLTAFAAGTFLYVALGDLLPEVFHHREGLPVRLGLLVLGACAGLLPSLLES